MPIPISQWLSIVAAEDREAARASADICPCSVRQKSGACIRKRPRARRRRSRSSRASRGRSADPGDGGPHRPQSILNRYPMQRQAWDDATALDDWDCEALTRLAVRS